MSTGLTHLDRDGNARMVDVAGKSASRRSALAAGRVRMSRAAYDSLRDGNNKKGDVLAVARIAGIQAAKRCSDLIPLCHPLALEVIAVDFNLDDASCTVDVLCRCALTGKTGVEMEALTGASVAALTIYDMCKAIDKGIEVEHLRLLEKTGGKSGGWRRDAQTGLAGQETPRAD